MKALRFFTPAVNVIIVLSVTVFMAVTVSLLVTDWWTLSKRVKLLEEDVCRLELDNIRCRSGLTGSTNSKKSCDALRALAPQKFKLVKY